jgi:Zn-dependent protease/predicted transcriptional regulator
MRGAFTIGQLHGIRIRVHFSFLLVLPLIVFMFARTYEEHVHAAAVVAGMPLTALRQSSWFWGTMLALGLALSVLLHELAHAVVALRKGGKVNDITLLMIGGVTHIAEPPREPRHESVMALVGPLMSFAIAAVCYAGHLLLRETTVYSGAFALLYLAGINAMLGAFNLLPAFPMDGGRILRGLLVRRMGVVRATELAATLGKVFAILFVLVGIFTLNVVLMLIAFFVYMGAEGEAEQVVVKSVLGQVRVRDLMDPPTPIASGETVARAVAHMLETKQLALPVTQEGKLVGLIALDDIKQLPHEQRAHVLLSGVMKPPKHCASGDSLWDVLQTMVQENLPSLPVVDEGRLVGVVHHDDLARALRLHELQSEPAQPRWPRGPIARSA